MESFLPCLKWMRVLFEVASVGLERMVGATVRSLFVKEVELMLIESINSLMSCRKYNGGSVISIVEDHLGTPSR